ncbi:hypothetical protein ACOBR2_15860 [Telmatobacter bradus]|uniref:hypothetical protein n=1 Tax=Telmatobacter bradus TaxID=474953 RepID=UPI003B4297EB
MKRLLALALLACASVCALHAQTVDTTVCDVVKHPMNFNGKTIRIKGVVFAGFDSFIIKDASECGFPIDSIWLEYPQGTKAKAGPAAVLHIQPAHNYAGPYQAPTRAAVTLDKSKDFKQFDSSLAQTHSKGAGMCLACVRSQVAATLIGRLDAVDDATVKHDAAGKVTSFGGFGNANMYPARLVLQSVADVQPKELDYSESDNAAKSLTAAPSDTFDPFDAATKLAAGIPAPSGDAAKKAIAALGKKGDKTSGVVFVSGTTNEVKDETPGKLDSSDGTLWTVTYNNDKVQGAGVVRMYFHMGQHIADLRTAGADQAIPPFIFEYNAWSMTVTAAVMSGEKLLTLSGGPVVWNLAWPLAQRQDKMNDGVTNYLNKSVAINR